MVMLLQVFAHVITVQNRFSVDFAKEDFKYIVPSKYNIVPLVFPNNSNYTDMASMKQIVTKYSISMR